MPGLLHVGRALSFAVLLAASLSAPVMAQPRAQPTGPAKAPTVEPVFDPRRVPALPESSAPVRSMTTEASVQALPLRRRVEILIETAREQLGRPYRWGGTTPATGFDCSGFAVFVYSKVGLALPRSAWEQVASGRPIQRDAVVPGDLLIFQNTYRPGPSHSAIYVGDGRFVHANDERTGVVTSLLSEAYWTTRYHSARRLID